MPLLADNRFQSNNIGLLVIKGEKKIVFVTVYIRFKLMLKSVNLMSQVEIRAKLHNIPIKKCMFNIGSYETDLHDSNRTFIHYSFYC